MNQVRLDTRECDRIAAKLGTNVDAVIRRAAFQIEELAKNKAPWDTTALKNSIYTATSKEDGYSKAASEANNKQPGVETEPFPIPEKEGYANVGACVNYAVYVEYPGAVRKGGERPYLTPAAEEVAKRYNSGKEWESIIL
jgi:hypothetical protein